MASAQILTNGKALYAYNGTEWVPLNTAGNLVNSTRWQYTAVGSETSLSGNDDNGESLIYTPGYEQVYLNGVLLARDADYTATTGTTITGLTALTAGYIVEVIAYNNINVGNTYTQAQIDSKVANTFERWTKTVSASGTVISGLDDNAVTLDYTAGLEKVYVNGILLAPEEYVATSGSVVTLDEAVVTNDIIQIHTLKNFRVPNTYSIAQTDQLFIPDSIMDAKGDLLTATADNTPSKLSVGSASTSYLRPDPSSSTGLKWDDDAWISYTPTWTGLTVGNATQTVVYKQIGKTVIVRGQITMGSTSSFSTDWTFSLPVTSKYFANNFVHFGTVEFRDAGTGVNYGTVGYSDQNNFYIFVLNSSTTYLSRSGISSTVPFTWVNGDSFSFYAIYEAA
jgi:hypothetical protein